MSASLFMRCRKLLLLSAVASVMICGPADATPHTREAFFVGGQYAEVEPGDHVRQGQMYVEHLAPLSPATQPFPMIFIHGATRTGVVSTWQTHEEGFFRAHY